MQKRPQIYKSSNRSRARSAVAAPPRHGQQQNQPAIDGEGQRSIYLRSSTPIEPSTMDKEARTVESVLATDLPVPIWDFRSGEVVDEVLIARGAQFERSVPLLRDHNQWSVTASLGDVQSIRAEGEKLVGRLHFGRDLGTEEEGIWKRVEQGILRKGSVGYWYERKDYETVPAGETRTVGGRSYTAAKDRAMRIVKRWTLMEYSMVVIPADSRAELRSDSQGTQPSTSHTLTPTLAPQRTQSSEDQMKKFLRFLHQHGLAASIHTETEALDWARSGNLSSELLDQLAALCLEEGVDFDRAAARSKQVESGSRSSGGQPQTPASTQPAQSPAVDNEQVRQAAELALANERRRVADIRALHSQHPEVPRTVVERAEREGWTVDQATREFLAALRTQRANGAPAIHSRGSHQINRRVLQAALLARSGITPDSPVLRTSQAESLRGRRQELDIGWAVGCPERGERRDELEQAFDVVSQQGLRGASFMRIAELCCELSDPNRRFFSEDEIIERAFSSGDFSAVFGAVVHMELLSSYASTPQTYAEWCEVVEVGDFRPHRTNDMGQVGRLKKMGRNGGEAALLNIDDPTEVSIAVERFAGQLVVDDQTLINDSFGVSGMLPRELGDTCKSMVDDLAFAQLISSANLGTSGRPRFNTTDGNLITGAINDATLTQVGTALRARKVGDRRIDVGQNPVAITGTALSPAMRRWMDSEFIADNMRNPHRGTYRLIEDTAVELGVNDPANNDALVAGTPGAVYFLASGAKRSIKFAWRRGTGRGPVTGPAISLTQTTTGQWGLAWKTYLDMGAVFQRRIGAVRLNIT